MVGQNDGVKNEEAIANYIAYKRQIEKKVIGDNSHGFDTPSQGKNCLNSCEWSED